MRKILLTVSYDGSDFHGSAVQRGLRTVEGDVINAVRLVTGEDIQELIGASRTDAGVHAYGNLYVFDTRARMDAESFAPALNTKLAPDVRAVFSEEVSADFHPRKTGWAKTYEYRILNSRMPDPILRKYTYHYRAPLDVRAMNEAASYLVGTHDFTSFCSVHSMSFTRERTVFSCETFEEVLDSHSGQNTAGTACPDGESITLETAREEFQKKIVTIRVKGSGFLYNMVRIIAGTLLDVGRGKTKPTDISDMLAARDRSAAGATLEPQGLFLMGYDRKGTYSCTTDL